MATTDYTYRDPAGWGEQQIDDEWYTTYQGQQASKTGFERFVDELQNINFTARPRGIEDPLQLYKDYQKWSEDTRATQNIQPDEEDPGSLYNFLVKTRGAQYYQYPEEGNFASLMRIAGIAAIPFGGGLWDQLFPGAGAGSLGLDAAIPQFGMEAATAADYAALGLGETAATGGTLADLATESQYLDVPFDPSNYTYPPGTPDIPTPPGGPPGTQGTTPVTPGTQPPAPVTDLSTAASAADIARLTASAAPGTALSRILQGNGTLQDWLSVGGTAGATLMGMYNSGRQADALKALSDQYAGYGAESRDLYSASLKPGFKPTDIPGFTGAYDYGLQSLMRQGSATAGNVMENPGVLAEINRTALGSVGLPAIQNWRNQLASTGGFGAFNTAAPGAATAAIGAEGGILKELGGGISSLINPVKTTSLEDLYRLFNSGKAFA